MRHAVKGLLKEESPLFDSLTKNLSNNPKLYQLLFSIVVDKGKWSYNPDSELLNLGIRHGYLWENKGNLDIANKIFEIRLLNYFTANKAYDDLNNASGKNIDDNGIVTDNHFNMDTCLAKFSQYCQRYYSQQDQRFIEREGRMLFLMFLAPVLNGQGFAYIEAQAPDGKRTDVIVNYLSQQFIIELKIWDGQQKHKEAFLQLQGYMDRFQTTEGYLLTFDFRDKKLPQHQWIPIDAHRKILDVIV